MPIFFDEVRFLPLSIASHLFLSFRLRATVVSCLFSPSVDIERLPPQPPIPRKAGVDEFCVVERIYRSSVGNEFLLIWVCGFVGLCRPCTGTLIRRMR